MEILELNEDLVMGAGGTKKYILIPVITSVVLKFS